MISISKNRISKALRIHSEAILDYCENRARNYQKDVLDSFIRVHFSPIVNTLEELIKAEPGVLRQLKIHYDGLTSVTQNTISENLDLRTLYDYFCNTDTFEVKSLSKIYNSKFLCEIMDVMTCPYCNENFTYSFKYLASNNYRRSFDWDHVYPKDIYPFFAISFFNLVPSCKLCNHLKWNVNLDYLNPYESFDPDSLIFFDVNVLKGDYLTNESSFEIDLYVYIERTNSDRMLHNITAMAIKERYKIRKDVVRDILVKKRFYHSSYFDNLYKDFKGKLFNTKDEMRRLVFGAYFNAMDYHKRPFSKLTRDIFNNKSI